VDTVECPAPVNTFCYTTYLADSYGDGWNGNVLSFTDSASGEAIMTLTQTTGTGEDDDSDPCACDADGIMEDGVDMTAPGCGLHGYNWNWCYVVSMDCEDGAPDSGYLYRDCDPAVDNVANADNDNTAVFIPAFE
ncbi:hypothetical protein TeGR_g14037, partial [Tetraparma gracilis]